MRSILHGLLLTTLLTSQMAYAAEKSASDNRYAEHVFVANKTKYKASFATDPKFINAWGIAIRPAGAGGHFWVVAKDISYEYVGDVSQSDDVKLRPLHQDNLKMVKFPVGGKDNLGTGVVFNEGKDSFVITQNVPGVEPITAPAKFMFASDGGLISAWTERKKEDGTFDRAHDSVLKIDESKSGAQFFGLALSHDFEKLYAADFGAHPQIRTYGADFKPLDITFDNPFDTNKNGKVDAKEYAPFNIQRLTLPNGDTHLFVTYAMTQVCGKEGLASHACKKGELFPGEEDTSKPGYGRLAEFTEDGKLVGVWNDGGHLSAPWGVAVAPENFGALSGKLLVANFGDGSIAAFDPETHHFVDYLRTEKGRVFKSEKIWGILFGNGMSLGDSNALYFSAGPNDENDGKFGSLRLSPSVGAK